MLMFLCFRVKWYVCAEENTVEGTEMEVPQNVMDKQSGVARLVVYLQDDKGKWTIFGNQ